MTTSLVGSWAGARRRVLEEVVEVVEERVWVVLPGGGGSED